MDGWTPAFWVALSSGFIVRWVIKLRHSLASPHTDGTCHALDTDVVDSVGAVSCAIDVRRVLASKCNISAIQCVGNLLVVRRPCLPGIWLVVVWTDYDAPIATTTNMCLCVFLCTTPQVGCDNGSVFALTPPRPHLDHSHHHEDHPDFDASNKVSAPRAHDADDDGPCVVHPAGRLRLRHLSPSEMQRCVNALNVSSASGESDGDGGGDGDGGRGAGAPGVPPPDACAIVALATPARVGAETVPPRTHANANSNANSNANAATAPADSSSSFGSSCVPGSAAAIAASAASDNEGHVLVLGRAGGYVA